jgi:hypothetical protein
MDPSLTGGVEVEMVNGACTTAKPVTINFDKVSVTGPYVGFPVGAGAEEGLSWSALPPSAATGNEVNNFVWTVNGLSANNLNTAAVVSGSNALAVWQTGSELYAKAPCGGKPFSLLSVYATNIFKNANAGLSVVVKGFDAAGNKVAEHAATPLLLTGSTPVTVDEQAFSGLSKVTVRLVTTAGGNNALNAAVMIDDVVFRPSVPV